MAEQRIRVGIVGAGANTRLRHIPGFRQIPGVEVAGVVNSTAASTASVAAEFGIPKTYGSWEQLVEHPDVDAVAIAAVPSLQPAIAIRALQLGKPVFAEKPMAADLAGAEAMAKAAEAMRDMINLSVLKL